MNSGLLLMAVMGLLFPAVLQATCTKLELGKSELGLSRFSNCLMLVTFAAYLFIQLKDQRNLYLQITEVGLLKGFLKNNAYYFSYDTNSPLLH